MKITSTQSTSIEITADEFAKAFKGLDPNDMACKMPSNEEIIARYKRKDYDLRTTDPGFYGAGTAMEKQDRAQAILEKEKVNGTAHEAGKKAAVEIDVDPGVCGREAERENRELRQAWYKKYQVMQPDSMDKPIT